MRTPEERERHLILTALHQDGVEEIFLPAPKRSQKPRTSKPLEPPPQTQGASRPVAKGNAVSTPADLAGVKNLEALQALASQCLLCGELAAQRRSVVFGSGSPSAKLMFVGEAPGHEEDLQGMPFVGEAGGLLTKIISAIGLTREQVFIANTLKCRPPMNRQPRPEEIANCSPYLMKQIEIIRPRIICALGAFASQTLLQTTEPISKLRGRWMDFRDGIKVMCTFHPAYLLRNPSEKRKVWEDMQRIQKELEGLA